MSDEKIAHADTGPEQHDAKSTEGKADVVSGQRFSLRHVKYDGKHRVNTPTSIEACHLRGVSPSELLWCDQKQFQTEGVPETAAKMYHEYYEQQRQKKLAKVKEKYGEMSKKTPRPPKGLPEKANYEKNTKRFTDMQEDKLVQVYLDELLKRRKVEADLQKQLDKEDRDRDVYFDFCAKRQVPLVPWLPPGALMP